MNNFALENYRPSRPLGQGAYGTVLLYELQLPNDTLPAKVAVKVFQSHEVASREWENMERLVASGLSHKIRIPAMLTNPDCGNAYFGGIRIRKNLIFLRANPRQNG